jgi:YVTN family beta-propeller protein
VCSDPLENGVVTINSCSIRIGGHPYRTTVDGQRIFIATDGQGGILQTTNGNYAMQPVAGWSPYSTLIMAPTPSGDDRVIINQNGIEIFDVATATVVQTIRGTISPLIALAGSKLFVAYDGRYWTIDTAKELFETLSSTPVSIQGTVASRPTAMAAVGSKLLIAGRMQQGSVTMSGISVIDASSKTVIFSAPLTGTPMRIAMNGTNAYIFTRAADTVTVLDTTSDTIVATIPLPGKPTDIAFDGAKALVTTYSLQTGSALITIDTQTVTVANTLTIPLGLSRIRAVTGKAYLIGGNEIQQNSYVYVVDTIESNATTMLQFPEIIHALEVSGDDLFVLFQNYAAAVAGDPLRGQVLVVDTRTDTVKDTCGGEAH